MSPPNSFSNFGLIRTCPTETCLTMPFLYQPGQVVGNGSNPIILYDFGKRGYRLWDWLL